MSEPWVGVVSGYTVELLREVTPGISFLSDKRQRGVSGMGPESFWLLHADIPKTRTEGTLHISPLLTHPQCSVDPLSSNNSSGLENCSWLDFPNPALLSFLCLSPHSFSIILGSESDPPPHTHTLWVQVQLPMTSCLVAVGNQTAWTWLWTAASFIQLPLFPVFSTSNTHF